MTINQSKWPRNLQPDLSFEKNLWEAGLLWIAGIDEAGRGALAGPVTAAALVLPLEPTILNKLSGVRDSKQLTSLERSLWVERVQQAAVSWGIGYASHVEIDSLGIVPATRLAMQRAIESLVKTPQHLLLDFLFLPECHLPQTALVKGDSRCLSIACASILAKTSRDAFMRVLEETYPGYGFSSHKGYCTPRHIEALQRLGPCPVHRRSFTPVKYYLEPIPLPENINH
jgi:ribonuclease HII